ncbi:MAG: hypothetical protein LBD46_02780, partial [Endomicrobium sp.]|nr:hypothetical protein [Endomicrobium sp.]
IVYNIFSHAYHNVKNPQAKLELETYNKEEDNERIGEVNTFTDNAGRKIDVVKLTQESNLENKKEKAKKFNGYKSLMAANRAAMSALSASDMDNALKYLADMIEALALIDSDTASRAKSAYANIEKDWAENKDVNKHININNEWSEENLEQINEIHTLINAVHQLGLQKLMSLRKEGKIDPDYKYMVSKDREERKIIVNNYSEGEISSQVKNFISNVINIGSLNMSSEFYYTFDEFYVCDNIIICSVKLGRFHSAEIIINLDSASDGIIASFYDPALLRAFNDNNIARSRVGRIFGFAAVLKNNGFGISDYKISGGIQVRYSAMDMQNMLSEYAEKFFLLVGFMTETGERHGVFRFQEGYGEKVNKEAAKIETSDFRNDSKKLKVKVLQDFVQLINKECRSILNKIKTARDVFKPIYDALGIPESRWFPEEIERYAAEGRATVDYEAKTAKLNKEYNPYEKFTKAFAEFERMQKDTARDLLLQGYAIDNLPYEDLFFRVEAIIRNTEIKSGWLKLKDGRKLAVKAITKRWESAIEAAYAEIVDIDGKRSEIEYAQLKELLEAEGYKIAQEKSTDGKLDKELERIIGEMNQNADIVPEKGLILKGTVFAKGDGDWVKGTATYDIENNSEGKILIREELSPGDIEKAGLGEGVIVMRGSEVMHSAISYREKKNKTGILKFGRWENGRLSLSYIKITNNMAKESNGYYVLEAAEGILVIQEGAAIEINGTTGEILIGKRPETTAIINNKYIDAKIRLIEAELNALKKYTLAKDLAAELEKAVIDSAIVEEILKQAEQEVIKFVQERLIEIRGLAEKSRLNVLQTELGLQLIEEAEYWKNYYGNKEIETAVKELSDKIKREEGESKAEIVESESLNLNDVSVYGSKSVKSGFLHNIIARLPKKTGLKIFAPGGMAVGKNIFERYMEGSEFSNLLRELEQAKENKNKKEAAEIGSRIQKLIRETDNFKVKEEIIKALGLKNDKIRYAVRSSGVGEDSKDNAFAGMGESCLNVNREQAVEHILKVWESFFSERSIDYMIDNGLTVMPAVLVQEMVEKVEKSGVIINGMIGAVFGLGEGIVSGRFSADKVQVTNGEITYVKSQGRSGKITVDERGGTKEVELNKAERGARVLTEEEVLLLNNIRAELENELGYPADIEWSIDEAGNIHILQIRPVTDFVKNYEIDYENTNNTTDPQDSAKLELAWASRIVDKLGIKDGWLRGIVVGTLEILHSTFLPPLVFVLKHYTDKNGNVTVTTKESDEKGYMDAKRAFYTDIKEFIPSLLPGFVSKHYGRDGPSEQDKQTQAYKLRVKGNIFIKTLSLAGFSLGIALPTVLFTAPIAIPFAILFAPILTFAFNITTHAVYNLTAGKTGRLEIETGDDIENSLIQKLGPDQVFVLNTTDLFAKKTLDARLFVNETIKKMKVGLALTTLISIKYNDNEFDGIGTIENERDRELLVQIQDSLADSIIKKLFEYSLNNFEVGDLKSKVLVFREMLKNAFVHGNNADTSKKIWIYYDGMDTISIINEDNSDKALSLEMSSRITGMQLYGAGGGALQSEEAFNSKFTRAKVDGNNVFISNITVITIDLNKSEHRIIDFILSEIDKDAKWRYFNEIPKSDKVYKLPKINEGDKVFFSGFEDEKIPIIFVTKENGKFQIANISNGFENLADEKFDIKEENGEYYLVTEQLLKPIEPPESSLEPVSTKVVDAHARHNLKHPEAEAQSIMNIMNLFTHPYQKSLFLLLVDFIIIFIEKRTLKIWNKDSIINFLQTFDVRVTLLSGINRFLKEEAEMIWNMYPDEDIRFNGYKELLEAYKQQLKDGEDTKFIEKILAENSPEYGKLTNYLQDFNKVKIEKGKVTFTNGESIEFDYLLKIIFDSNVQAHREESKKESPMENGYPMYDFKKVLFLNDTQRMDALKWVIIALNKSFEDNSLLLPAERRVKAFTKFMSADPTNPTEEKERINWQARVEHVLHYISIGVVNENIEIGNYEESPLRYFSYNKYINRNVLFEVDDFVKNYEIDYENTNNTTDPQDSAKLELAWASRILDKLGLKDGWLRGIVVETIEILYPTFLPPLVFVLKHYTDKNGNVTVTADDAYRARMSGARRIFFGTWAIAAVGAAVSLMFAMPVVWAISAAIVYNIFSHAYHNVKNPQAKLALESWRQLSLFNEEKTSSGRADENEDDDNIRFVQVEKREGFLGEEVYIGITEEGKTLQATIEDYLDYLERLSASNEEQNAKEAAAEAAAAMELKKAEWKKARKEVMEAAYKTIELDINKDIRVKLPSNNTVVFKKYFEKDGRGVCSVELIGIDGKIIRETKVFFYNPRDIRGLEKYNRKNFAAKSMQIAFGQSNTQSGLELAWASRIADRLGLKDGWLRGIVVGTLEILHSTFLPPL